MKLFHKIALAVSSGLLLTTAWYSSWGLIFLFIAFVPLLLIEESQTNSPHKNHFEVFNYSYIAFFIWNILTTYWIYKATPVGAILAVLANSALMALIFWAYHLSRKATKNKIGRYAFIIWWLAFEHMFFHTEISWPWLTLGNAFSANTHLVQWYEYTGVLGGSLWVLLSNTLIMSAIGELAMNRATAKNRLITNGVLLLIIIVSPIIVSYSIYSNYKETGTDTEVLILQPNIDPYHEKFGSMGKLEQITRLINLTDNNITEKTQYVVAPETAIVETIWERHTNNYASIQMIREFLKENEDLAFVIGANTKREYSGTSIIPATARKFKGSNIWYDRYNAALQITPFDIDIYHKSKLVLGVEKMPYYKYFKFLDYLAADLGGTTGSLGFQKESSVFTFKNSTIAPIICYESVYPEYVSEYVRKGASLLFIITNDGWWGNTPGYKQHFRYAKLRAIENRRAIARSANTGISAFIDQRGDVIKQTGWWEATTIKATIKANNKATYFSRNGSFIGRVAVFSTVLIMLYVLVTLLIRKKVRS
jgi:apolipoprotein N-acyltransferase